MAGRSPTAGRDRSPDVVDSNITIEPDSVPGRAVCVYCASSRTSHPDYREAASRLGETLAGRGITVIYGGGAKGSMGALADGALSKGGRVIGILPRFMDELEWGHRGLSELRLVEDMRTRKHLMLTAAQAAVALPGGCGTLEELLEAITLKRLGLFLGPIVLVNTRGYFHPLLEMLSRAVDEHFMDTRHALMWQVVARPEDVPDALDRAPAWTAEFRSFAAI
ncbi:MAG: TIGR00730 family Rossman fold protein [Gammaproteobacteria bacterium]|nr:TIGR00730 family Rossman fold protein [Gammaproteobacteria bacterium]